MDEGNSERYSVSFFREGYGDFNCKFSSKETYEEALGNLRADPAVSDIQTTETVGTTDSPVGRRVDEAPREALVALVVNDELFHCRVTVFCDTCHVEDQGEYLVRESDPAGVRSEYARAHLRQRGWTCDERGDFCPEHTPEKPTS